MIFFYKKVNNFIHSHSHNNKTQLHNDILTMDKHVLCPILHIVMLHPVFAPDGHTYEEDAILEWVEKQHTSPITREPMKAKFKTNFSLLAIIEDYMRENPTATRYTKPIKPKIFSWKEFETMKTFEKEKQYINDWVDFQDLFCDKMCIKSKHFGEMLKYLCETHPVAIGSNKDKFQNEIFCKVVMYGDYDLFEWFLQKFNTFDTNEIPEDGKYNSFLCMVISRFVDVDDEQSLKIVKTLCEKGANINDISRNRPPALSIAIENNLFDVVEYLLDNGADAWIYCYDSTYYEYCPMVISINCLATSYVDEEDGEYDERIFDLIIKKCYTHETEHTINLVLFAIERECHVDAITCLLDEEYHLSNCSIDEENKIIKLLRNKYDECEFNIDRYCTYMFNGTLNHLLDENAKLKELQKRLVSEGNNGNNKRPKTQHNNI